jgi:hypothetical protein
MLLEWITGSDTAVIPAMEQSMREIKLNNNDFSWMLALWTSFWKRVYRGGTVLIKKELVGKHYALSPQIVSQSHTGWCKWIVAHMAEQEYIN